MRLSPALVVSASLFLAAVDARAAVDLDQDSYRLFCGYFDTLEQPAVQKLPEKKRDDKIAQLAKVKKKQLLAAVEKGRAVGATCAEIGKKVEADIKAKLDKEMAGRITLFDLDYSDPSHVVARVQWLGIDKKKLVQEASIIGWAVASEGVIVKTLAIRAVDPTAADKNADEASWFDAKISRTNAQRIDREKIPDYAETRYLRLFDGVVRKE